MGAGRDLRAVGEEQSIISTPLAVCASMPPVRSNSGWRGGQQAACISGGHPSRGTNGQKVRCSSSSA